jgi:hypothetical protein
MLIDIDSASRTWGTIEDWANAELAKAREQNDSPMRTEVQTAVLRGRIKLLKELIALPLPDKKETRRPKAVEPEDY